MEQEVEQNQNLSKSQRRKLRKEQKQAQKQALRKKQQMKKVVGVLSTLVVFIVVIFAGIKLAQKSEASKPGEKVASQGNDHIQIGEDHVAYNTTPPTSGPHAGTARWGIHEEQIPDENQIHNLEDGGIGIQYDCDEQDNSCRELVENLKGVVKKSGSKIFMGPYSGISNRIALTAWQRIDTFDNFDEERILDFIDAYRGIDHHVKVGR